MPDRSVSVVFPVEHGLISSGVPVACQTDSLGEGRARCLELNYSCTGTAVCSLEDCAKVTPGQAVGVVTSPEEPRPPC